MNRALNVIVFCACVFLLAYCAWLSMSIIRCQRASDEYVTHYVNWLKAAQEMRHASLFLTREARQYALTLDRGHMERYLGEVYKNKSREHSLKMLCDSGPSEPVAAEELVKALENSVALAQKEQYALRLIAESEGEDLKQFPNLLRNVQIDDKDSKLDRELAMRRARQLLFDNDYIQEQEAILEPIHQFEEANNKAILKKHQEIEAKVETQGRALQICLALLFICAVFFIARLQTKQVHL